jgi:hypothetical protein
VTIRAYHQRILEVFVLCAKNSLFDVTEPIVRIDKGLGQICKFYLSEPLKLRCDIQRGNDLANGLAIEEGEIEILISPEETIAVTHSWTTIKSTVEVAYVLNTYTAAPSELLIGVHYDFENDAMGEPKPGHPLFHASLTTKLFNLSPLLGAANVSDKRMRGMPSMRLPTAHMSFVSVLLNTAADRFTPENFDTFLGEVRGKTPFPFMANTNFQARLVQNQSGMRSCVWYPNLLPEVDL